MSVFDGDTVAVGADGEVGRNYLASLEFAEKFAGLFLHLLFFILDEGHDVAEDVQGGNAGIARAADRLHGYDKDGLNTESLLQGRQRNGEAHDGAVGVGDHEATGLLPPGLELNELEVVGIDFRNDERHLRVHAEGRGV